MGLYEIVSQGTGASKWESMRETRELTVSGGRWAAGYHELDGPGSTQPPSAQLHVMACEQMWDL